MFSVILEHRELEAASRAFERPADDRRTASLTFRQSLQKSEKEFRIKDSF